MNTHTHTHTHTPSVQPLSALPLSMQPLSVPQANERQPNMPELNGLQPVWRSKARRSTHPLTNIPSLPLTFPTLQAITLRVTTPMVQALSLLATTHTLRAPSLRALSRQAPTLLPAPTPTFQPPTTLQCTLYLVVVVRSIRPDHDTLAACRTIMAPTCTPHSSTTSTTTLAPRADRLVEAAARGIASGRKAEARTEGGSA